MAAWYHFMVKSLYFQLHGYELYLLHHLVISLTPQTDQQIKRLSPLWRYKQEIARRKKEHQRAKRAWQLSLGRRKSQGARWHGFGWKGGGVARKR